MLLCFVLISAISGVATAIESVVDGGLQPQKISTTVVPFKNLIRKVGNDFMRHQRLFIEQLNDVEKILNESNSTDYDNIRKTVSNVTMKMQNENKFSAMNITTELQSGKKAIENVLSVTKTYFEELKKNEEDVDVKTKEKNILKSLHRIEKMQSLLKVADVSIDIYKQNRQDNAKLDEINTQIANYQDQIQTWKLYEENVKTIMLPQLIEMQSSFDKSSQQLSGKSHVLLDISKWKMQGALSDLKKLFREMATAQESLLGSDLVHCIEKIGDGITTMITVYDRIDSYTEQSKLAALISNVAIRLTSTSDTALLNMDNIIKTNLVLERFASLSEAIKQHTFPYAQRYMHHFQFPSDLQSNHTERVIETISANIHSLQNELRVSESALERKDFHTFSDFRFDSSQPFYTWHYRDYNIHQLLGGAQITLKSDIYKGVNFTAVKFKDISIKFKLENQLRQQEFDGKLEQFQIVMTMVGNGNSYYRCNNRIYYLSMDEDVAFLFHMRNGTVLNQNDSYRKISTSDYFLSPYTVWNIQLRYSNFDVFQSFKNEKIDLQLTGVGQLIYYDIVRETTLGKPDTSSLCNADLDNYYTLDGIDDQW